MVGRKYKALRDKDILKLLKDKTYIVDPETGLVYNRVGWLKQKPIPPYKSESKRSNGYNVGGVHYFVRLHCAGGRKGVSLAKLVWMSVTLRTVPKGFEIHHWDENRDNNSWPNLYCLYKDDHRKLHNGCDPSEVPF